MDAYHGLFRWHGKYLPLPLEAERLLLLSDGDALLFDTPGVADVARALAQGTTLSAYCDADGAPGRRLAVMLHALASLVSQGHIQPCSQAGGGAGETRYEIPDFSAPFARLPVADEVDAINLSRGVGDAAARGWAREAPLRARGPVTVVFCDDLLDPRLQAVDRWQRSHGRAWLPVKATGESALLGPVFSPRDAGTACWRCLAHRLARNQPVRAWWRSRHGEWPRSPVRCDTAWVSGRLDALRPLVASALGARPVPQRILALDADGPAAQAHPVAPRPQCPACGTPTLMAERQRRPIVPAPGPAARGMPPRSTVERLRAHVSPLSGLASHLDGLASQDGDGLAIHRSGFFKTPRPGDPPLAASFVQTCLGKGWSPAQSQASALCEAVERYAAFYQGDEAVTSGPAAALDAPCVLPSELAPAGQGRRGRGAPGACHPGTPMRWAPAWSLTRQARCHLPLGFCYAHAPAEDTRHIGWTSNGCAAGNTLEEAIFQGFLELVERDAVAVWWYNRIERPAADLAGVPASRLRRTAELLGPRRDHWVLDLTHDIGIPVAAAIARHRDTGDWAVGFGCGPSLPQACGRALAELAQLVVVDKPVPVPPAEAPSGGPRFLLPSARAAPPKPWQVPARTDIAEAIGDCVRAVAALGLETLVLDYSRPDIALHTVKVVVPGLCHIWPELTTARLRRVPVALGWRKRPLARHELNPQALYV